MFEKVKKFVKSKVESVKTALTVKEAQIKGCAHAVVDGIGRGYMACVPHTSQVDGGIAHSPGSHRRHEC